MTPFTAIDLAISTPVLYPRNESKGYYSLHGIGGALSPCASHTHSRFNSVDIYALQMLPIAVSETSS